MKNTYSRLEVRGLGLERPTYSCKKCRVQGAGCRVQEVDYPWQAAAAAAVAAAGGMMENEDACNKD